jgi:hypothetical protein
MVLVRPRLEIIRLQEFLLGMLAAALRGHGGERAFHELEQRLLHALARHVARYRRVVGLARDLVDLVDVDDAALRALDVVVAVLQQLQHDVLDVLADVAGLGQRRRVGHRERHVKNPGQRLREQRFARTGGADQQDVRFRQLDFRALHQAFVDALVMVVHRDGKDAFRALLADDVVIEHLLDLARRGNALAGLDQLGLVLFLDDVHAEFDAFITDEYVGSRDQLPHLMLAFAAKGAVQRVLGIPRTGFAHLFFFLLLFQAPASAYTFKIEHRRMVANHS